MLSENRCSSLHVGVTTPPQPCSVNLRAIPTAEIRTLRHRAVHSLPKVLPVRASVKMTLDRLLRTTGLCAMGWFKPL